MFSCLFFIKTNLAENGLNEVGFYDYLLKIGVVHVSAGAERLPFLAEVFT